jgi:bacterioferritin-associated ferredoxin
MYVCICRGVTEAEVRQAGRAGVIRSEDLIALFGFADPACCGRCARRSAALVALAAEGRAGGAAEPVEALPSRSGVRAGPARVAPRARSRAVPVMAGSRREEG